MARRPVIGVMGSHSEPWDEYAEPLGQWIASQGFHLLTGAGQGVMLSVSRAFHAVPGRRGLVIGVVPSVLEKGRYLSKDGYPNEFVELAIYSPLGTFIGEDPHELSRNHINAMTSDALVCLPGAVGTRNEAELAVRLGKPAILFGPEGAFEGFPPELTRTSHLQVVCAFLAPLAHSEF